MTAPALERASPGRPGMLSMEITQYERSSFLRDIRRSKHVQTHIRVRKKTQPTHIVHCLFVSDQNPFFLKGTLDALGIQGGEDS